MESRWWCETSPYVSGCDRGTPNLHEAPTAGGLSSLRKYSSGTAMLHNTGHSDEAFASVGAKCSAGMWVCMVMGRHSTNGFLVYVPP